MTNDSSFPARDDALSLLDRRVLSTEQLREKLTESKYPADAVQQAIDDLTGHGYLNDDYIVDALVDKARRESRGSLWLEQKLTERKLDSSRIDLGCRAIEKEEHQLAQQAISARYQPPWSVAVLRRASQYLGRRGFQPDTIEAVLTAVAES